jgi:uroporphyrinogen-III decarboxylase
MNTQERFLAIMTFQKADRTLFWEMGYWKETLQRWYEEGLPRELDVTVALKSGEGVRGENAPHEEVFARERKRDVDVHNYLGFDKGVVCLPINSLLSPQFDKKIYEETEDSILFQDEFGVKKRMNKKVASRPQFLEWPAQDRRTFEVLKERLKPNFRDRIPPLWKELVREYRNRDFPLTIGGYPIGFYGALRFLMGEERLLFNFYDDPGLVHDFMNTLAEMWIGLWGETFSDISVDCVTFWEDMAYRSGPIISPKMFREFMLTPYRKVTSFLQDMGVKIIMVDCDGNIEKLAPLFMEAGITAIYPFEVQAGNDIVSFRQKYPRLQILGGIDKMKIAMGKAAIDEELDSKIPVMLRSGGYIPHVDHHVHPDVSWENFKYYRARLEEIILEYCCP